MSGINTFLAARLYFVCSCHILRTLISRPYYVCHANSEILDMVVFAAHGCKVAAVEKLGHIYAPFDTDL